MKIALCVIGVLLLPFNSFSQSEKEFDSTAIFILDKMSSVIGELHSVSIDVETSIDEFNDQSELEKHYATSIVKLSGPNKLAVQIEGDKGQKGYWYDGEFLSFYHYDENNYITLAAPDSTLTMIDTMHKTFEFQFPTADFFYPTFVDDLMENFDSIKYMGQKTIASVSCFNIMCVSKDKNVQLWITNDEQMLPKRFVIIYKNDGNRQYESTFKKWDLNPTIPDAIFDFLPPPKAKLISIMAKS